MSDNAKKTGQADRIRININQPHEMQYWQKTLNVSAQQLTDAVKAVGPMVEDVRKHLRK